jgi:hypothetical protein
VALGSYVRLGAFVVHESDGRVGMQDPEGNGFCDE